MIYKGMLSVDYFWSNKCSLVAVKLKLSLNCFWDIQRHAFCKLLLVHECSVLWQSKLMELNDCHKLLVNLITLSFWDYCQLLDKDHSLSFVSYYIVMLTSLS